MNKRIVLICIVSFFLIFSITGCWSKVELDKHTIVAGMGIDIFKAKEGIKLTVQAVIPEEVKEEVILKEGQKPVWIGTVSGSSINDAVRNLALTTGSETLWAHSQILVLGEDVAKTDLRETIDWFERSIEVRRRIYVMVAKGEAKDIIEAKGEMENIPAFNIGKLIEGSGSTSKAASVDLLKFIGALTSKTTCAFLPGIVVYNKEDGEGKTSKAVKLEDTAIFKDYKLRGWINPIETRGLLWILGEVKSGIIDVEDPFDEKALVTFEIIRASSKIKPEVKDGKIIITVEIKEESNIGAMISEKTDVTKPENIKKLEESQEKAIEEEINEAINKAKEYNTDIFGFGEAIHRKYPEEWKKMKEEWDDIFPNLEVQVKVNAKIDRTGLITKKRW